MPEREPHIHVNFPPFPFGTPPLWAGVVLAPAAWAGQMLAIYALAGPACARQSLSLFRVLDVLFLLIAIASGIICWRYRDPGNDESPQQKRTKFFADYGIFASVYFSIVIIAQAITIIMLDPCMT
jgi:hypothetical protein